MSTVACKDKVREVRFEGAIWVGVDVHKNSYADIQNISYLRSLQNMLPGQ